MPKNCRNKYPNIFGCPRVDKTNIRIHLDAQQLIEIFPKYIQTKEKAKIQTKKYFMQAVLL